MGQLSTNCRQVPVDRGDSQFITAPTRNRAHTRLHVFRDNCHVNLLSSAKQAGITAESGKVEGL
jgi:hypothetical protein